MNGSIQFCSKPALCSSATSFELSILETVFQRPSLTSAVQHARRKGSSIWSGTSCCSTQSMRFFPRVFDSVS